MLKPGANSPVGLISIRPREAEVLEDKGEVMDSSTFPERSRANPGESGPQWQGFFRINWNLPINREDPLWVISR